MKELKDVSVCKLNQVNLNYRKYIKDSFKDFKDVIPVRLGISDISDIDPKEIIGEASNFKFDENNLLSDIKLFDDTIDLGNEVFVINSIGMLEDTYIKGVSLVKECELLYISIIAKDKSAFNMSEDQKEKLNSGEFLNTVVIENKES